MVNQKPVHVDVDMGREMWMALKAMADKDSQPLSTLIKSILRAAINEDVRLRIQEEQILRAGNGHTLGKRWEKTV